MCVSILSSTIEARALNCYLQAWKRSMPHILFILPYPFLGASARCRVEQYFGLLKDSGFTWKVSTFYTNDEFRAMIERGSTEKRCLAVLRAVMRRLSDLTRLSGTDIVFVHREAFPIGPPIIEEIAAQGRRKLVYDFDDAVYLTKPDAVYPWLNSLRNPGKIGKIIKRSSLTVAGNETLADFARTHCKNVLVLPTPVDTEVFCPKKSPRQDEKPVIGWIGGPGGIRFLDFLKPVLRELSSKHSFKVHIVGGRWECEGVEVHSEPWMPNRDVLDLQGFDIGLMPLPDTPWNRGKCSYKLLQYMSCAKPGIASPVGMNKQVVKEGRNGFLADTPEEWRGKLDLLLSDRDLRESLGKEGRKLVESEYSVKALGPRLVGALRDIVE